MFLIANHSFILELWLPSVNENAIRYLNIETQCRAFSGGGGGGGGGGGVGGGGGGVGGLYF